MKFGKLRLTVAPLWRSTNPSTHKYQPADKYNKLPLPSTYLQCFVREFTISGSFTQHEQEKSLRLLSLFSSTTLSASDLYFIIHYQMFLIIHEDKPIFEQTFNKPQKLQTYFVIHSALDSIDNTMKQKRDFYLGLIKNQDIPIFCYVNAVGLKLILVFTAKRDFDKKTQGLIRDFLVEANKTLAYALLNPLYNLKSEIRSPIFNQKIMNLGKQFLRPFFDKKK